MPGVSGLSPRLAADGILNYVPELNEICKITCKTIFNLDSSNIQPEKWKVIAQETYEEKLIRISK